MAEIYPTGPQLIRNFEQETLQTHFVDEEWAPLDSGVAVPRDRVLEQVNEHKNHWTLYLEIACGCPRNCPAGKGQERKDLLACLSTLC